MMSVSDDIQPLRSDCRIEEVAITIQNMFVGAGVWGVSLVNATRRVNATWKRAKV
jgi:hypothetical protein